MTASRLLLLGCVGFISSLPLKAANGTIEQILWCQLYDNEQKSVTYLTIYENGMLSAARFGNAAKSRYIDCPMTYQHIPAQEARDFVAGLQQRAVQAQADVRSKTAAYDLNMTIMLSEKKEDFRYNIAHRGNSPQIDTLYQYLTDFIRSRHVLLRNPTWIPKDAPNLQ